MALVVAMAENGVIGNANRLPWHLPADLKHFKALTMGKPMLMGRKTFDSIGKALPGRRNLVMTRGKPVEAPGVETVPSVEAALAATREATELMVIGGAEIFRLCLPRAERIYLTRIHAPLAGDTRFPNVDWNEWHAVQRTPCPADEKNAYAMTFLVLERGSVKA
ncbi:MAG TPA: dihydrofolate reductase [Steroidobacteraceae bacterium]|nr:dihydrofolate reductase [Steroidobacteraceae bacterium]